jgi:hypothetical protein
VVIIEVLYLQNTPRSFLEEGDWHARGVEVGLCSTWRLGRPMVLFAQTIIFAFTHYIPNFPFSPPMSPLGTAVINSTF